MPASIQLDVSKTDALLAKLPVIVRGEHLMGAVKKAARVVEDAAQFYAPRSADTGTTQLLSQTEKDRRGWPNKPLAKTITSAVREYPEAVVGVVGPQYPAGAHGHLIEDGHKLVAWGNETDLTVEEKPFLEPASERTLAVQQRVIEKHLAREIEKVKV